MIGVAGPVAQGAKTVPIEIFNAENRIIFSANEEKTPTSPPTA
jgi:hypothetical protein